MGETKFVFKSKTIIGALLSIATLAKIFFDINVSETEITTILGSLDTLVEVGMAIVSQVLIIWGRISAKGSLHLSK